MMTLTATVLTMNTKYQQRAIDNPRLNIKNGGYIRVAECFQH
jgi:hypothetical protein